MRKILLVFCVFVTFARTAMADAYSRLDGDTLVIGNDMIERSFIWNGGSLITTKVQDKRNDKVFLSNSKTPDCYLVKGTPADGHYEAKRVESDGVHEAHLLVSVSCRIGTLEILRHYRVYDECAVIGCDTYLRGAMAASNNKETSAADRKNIEFVADMATEVGTPTLDRLQLNGKHWQTRVVEFFDVTDWNDNLVTERTFIPYRKTGYRGNLLIASDNVNGGAFFLLKEAPTSSTQLAYPGKDFITEFGTFLVTGIGLSSKDVTADKWTRAYSCVLGVAADDGYAALATLRHYQKGQRLSVPSRDEMVMMNTWGDRSQDAKIDEAFCLAELDKAKALGLSCFQLDDGWQTGKSPNSAVAKGSFTDIWQSGDYWTPDKKKFPRGLSPIVKKGKKLGIRIGLWYNPSVQDEFADWDKDADAILGLYRQYGITVFKIDGVKVETKKAEENLRNLFDKVLRESNNEVVFNLDVTAGRRGGYFMLNEYGNIFLENRYTDWGNYYPYRTLRNLWMLSRYVPAERLQIEFLNKWRNKNQYTADPFGPENYSFEYLFAITMAAQPLAWMEASGLPDEAFAIKPAVETYRNLQHELHQGTILPVGDEPSGRSWTGFQSDCGDKGFFIVYRENNDEAVGHIKTWLAEGCRVSLKAVLGEGRDFIATVGKGGMLDFSLPEKNSYGLYRYEIISRR